MIPVDYSYIKKPYTINNCHYVVENEDLTKQIHKKATKYLLLVEQNKFKPNVDIMGIKNRLKKSDTK